MLEDELPESVGDHVLQDLFLEQPIQGKNLEVSALESLVRLCSCQTALFVTSNVCKKKDGKRCYRMVLVSWWLDFNHNYKQQANGNSALKMHEIQKQDLKQM